MTPNEKTAAVASKLIRLTREGALTWKKTLGSNELPEDSNHRVTACYETTFQGRRLALYAERVRGEFARDVDDVIEWWNPSVGLAVLDNKGSLEWRFPSIPGLDDLLEAVRYRTGNIDGLLDELMKTG